MTLPIHENANYAVVAVKGSSSDAGSVEDTYKVYNKGTGITEYKDSQIANAITYAEHANSFLKNKLWGWIEVQGSKNKEQLDKESSVVIFEAEAGILGDDDE